MTRELTRDLETNKLRRDSATSSLIRAETAAPVCLYCDPGATPDQITLTLSGLTECTNCRQDQSGVYYKPFGCVSFLNGIVHVLDHIPQASPSTNCLWRKTYTGNFGGLIRYIDNLCTISSGTYLFTTLILGVVKLSATTIQIEVGFNGATQFPPWAYRAFWYVGVATFSDCIGVSGLGNQLNCVTSPITLRPVCSGGLATIVEGPTTQIWKQERLPISDASVQWSPGVNNNAQLDDIPGAPDDDSSYTYTNTLAAIDYLNFNSFNVPTGSTIANVQIVFRGKLMTAGGTPHVRTLLRVNTGTYYGAGEQLFLGGYTTFTTTWTTNPATGNAWTANDINGIGSRPLQTFGYQYMSFSRVVRATQCYIKVNYTY